MKRLRDGVLVAGDIILTTTNKPDSKAIRKVTKSDISHAMVYVDPCSVIDATGEGVHARNTQRMFFPEDCAIHALRPKIPLSRPEVEIICNFVRSRVGTEYSKREAAATFVTGLRSWSSKQFCSRLVAQAYASAGRILVSDPSYCSPEDIRDSPMLDEVRDATEAVTDHEVERWKRDLDMTQITRDTTNAVLEGMRKKSKDIQNLNDVDAHMIEHPEDDAYYCDVLKSSGYLKLWELEMRKNPWQYDVAALEATGWPDEQIESYCRMTLETAKNGGKRYHLNKAGYLHLSDEYSLQSFAILSSLYETLADLDMQRYQVATQWLNAQNTRALIPDPYAAPHSPEWLATLENWNPYQAMMARMATEQEGKLDVCSVCGEAPAPVYRTEEAPAPGSVATLRLCDDCLQIRKLKGENFIPLTMTLIFQYGSNCSESEINGDARLRGNATFVGIAETVEDCQLIFDVHSTGRGCAAADIVAKPGSKVWGVLYEVPDFLIERKTAKQQGRKALDQIEGEGTNYTRRTIDVKCPDGTICTATTYTARKPGCDVPTSLAYVRYIVEGLREHGVSEHYIAEVKMIASANNPAIAADVNAL